MSKNNFQSVSILTFTFAVTMVAVSSFAVAQDADNFGKDIPLNMAARQIVPDGYKIQMGPGVDESKQVTWKTSGADSWKKAISAAARSGGYLVNFSGKEVRIVSSAAAASPVSAPVDETHKDMEKPNAAKPRIEPRAEARSYDHYQGRRAWRHEVREHEFHEHKRDVEEVAGGPSVPASGFVILNDHKADVVTTEGPDMGPRRPSMAVNPAPAPVGATFDAVAGTDLAGTLQDWGSREGWIIKWKSKYSYKLTASARFHGDFMSASTELLRSMASVRPQVTADFYKGNKVLVVGNDGPDEAADAAN